MIVYELYVLQNGLVAGGGNESTYCLWDVEQGKLILDKKFPQLSETIYLITQLCNGSIILGDKIKTFIVINIAGDIISNIECGRQSLF
jgi:hypothetical protein